MDECFNDLVNDNSGELVPITINSNTCIEMCNIHNEECVVVCECNRMFCKNCDRMCDKSHPIHTIGYCKTQAIEQMKNLRAKLTNQINGLNCIMELTKNEYESIKKQIEDIIDTILININHIDDFINNINNIPFSNIIKRKNQILNNKFDILIDITTINNEILITLINFILKNELNINAHDDNVLWWASSKGYLDIVKCLIKYGAEGRRLLGGAVDVHSNNNEALTLASRYGHLDIV